MKELDLAMPLRSLPETTSRGFLYVLAQFEFRRSVCFQLYGSIYLVLFEVDEFHEAATYLLDITGEAALVYLHLKSQISWRHPQSTIEHFHV